MNDPLVTVICNCYNHEEFVTQALNSVLDQTYKNIELIVLNNGSTDGSLRKIQDFTTRHPSVKLLNLAETLPHTQAFNMAFKQANGSYLVDLSADDVLLPQCIQEQISCFAQQPSTVAIVFGNAFHIDENGMRHGSFFETDENQLVKDKELFQTDYERLLNTGIVMCSVSAMYTRRHFELLKGFNEKLIFEDLDYWLRTAYSYEIRFIDVHIVEKRELSSSLGNQFFKNDSFSENINKSLRIIYSEAIKRNTKKENNILLKRIHHSMDKTFRAKNYSAFFKFAFLELKCRLKSF